MIRKYKDGDALKVDVQDEQKVEAKFNAKFFDSIVAYSVVENEKVLGVFGFEVVDEKAYCFALLGKYMQSKMYEFVKFVKRKIELELSETNVSKVLFSVKEEFFNARRMAEILGFYEVAKLPLFFNGENYLLYERKE